jgi:uncharacterized protein
MRFNWEIPIICFSFLLTLVLVPGTSALAKEDQLPEDFLGTKGVPNEGQLANIVSEYALGNYKKALAMTIPLADQGNAYAQHYLGVMYEKGTGVPQDYTEAVKWHRKAAEQKKTKAQYYLGVMYWKGLGVPQDFVQAYKWFHLAASQLKGQLAKHAVNNRDSLKEEMTPTQVMEAKKLALEWKPKQSK